MNEHVRFVLQRELELLGGEMAMVNDNRLRAIEHAQDCQRRYDLHLSRYQAIEAELLGDVGTDSPSGEEVV